MAMLFLYFAGMLVMFVFVIRSLASQGDERRDAFRKQQLMLGDLERQLIDMKVMLRRLAPDHEDEADAAERDSGLPLLKGEDPLESMLEAALGKEGKPSQEKTPGEQGKRAMESQGEQTPKGRPLPSLSVGIEDKSPSSDAAAEADLGLPDFFAEPKKPEAGSMPLGAHMFPPHESLGKSRDAGLGIGQDSGPSAAFWADKKRKPVSFLSLDSSDERPKASPDVENKAQTTGQAAFNANDMADDDNSPLQVFSIGKNPKLQERKDLSAEPVLHGAPLTVKPEAPVLSKSMESIRQAFSVQNPQAQENDPLAPAQKPRLRVSGPADFDGAALASSIAHKAPSPSGTSAQTERQERSLPGVGGALFAARGSSSLPGKGARAAKEAEDGESLKHIYEEGLKADDSVNLFDIEAEKEERKRDDREGEAGQEQEQKGPSLSLGLEDPLPQGFTVVRQSPRVDDVQLVEQTLPLEKASPAADRAGDAATAGEAAQPKLLSRRVGKYSFEAVSVEEISLENAPGDAEPAAASAEQRADAAPSPPLAEWRGEGSQDKSSQDKSSQDESSQDERPQGGEAAVVDDGADPALALAAERAQAEREQGFFNPKALHPIDQKVLSRRKLPGKKGRRPTPF